MGDYSDSLRPFTMEPQSKTMRTRGAVVLLCGLALACTVMYLTTDGDDVAAESTLLDLGKEQRVVTWDTEKVNTIYTNVPNHGRVRLLDYFKEIEKRIASETASRQKDVAAIKTKMLKNRQYNAAQRSKMKKALLKKMAINAKKAKDDLDHQMALTARAFHKQAALENRRHRADIARFKKTRAIMRANKRAHAKALRLATRNQQRALATLDAETNAKIRKSEKSIAANAAQIKLNAKKARDELDAANKRFNAKMFATRQEAAKGRSKLAATAASMDKKMRAMISGKVQAEAMSVASRFAKVRATMAKDRANADKAVKDMSTKLAGALNAQKLLQDQRFAKTVKSIDSARKEANAAIKKAQTYFKTKMLHLSETVKAQVTKLNKHRAVLSKKDKAMNKLIAKNKSKNRKAMTQMANSFKAALSKIRKQMKADRAHAE